MSLPQRTRLLFVAALVCGCIGNATAGGVSNQLLLSSAWCSFAYSQISGATTTTRARFFANGTYSFGNQRESVSSGSAGSVYGRGGGASGGRWRVINGELYMGEDGDSLEPVRTVVKRNSNGYPIIVADGVEYMQC